MGAGVDGAEGTTAGCCGGEVGLPGTPEGVTVIGACPAVGGAGDGGLDPGADGGAAEGEAEAARGLGDVDSIRAVTGATACGDSAIGTVAPADTTGIA